MADDIRILSTAAELRAFGQRASDEAEVAVDTEFHAEHGYWPRLMLVQVATRRELVIVDPLARGIGGQELGGLLEVLFAPERTVVGHALDRDLEILLRAGGLLPRRVWDTQVAASFLGPVAQPGLAKLLASFLGIELAKQFTMADWSRRPLPADLADYAADDVRHLLPLGDALRAELAKRDRLAWVEDECAALVDPVRYGPPDPESAWRQLRSRSRGDLEQVHRLKALAAERERIAMELDRPRRAVLPDDLLEDLARRAPRSSQEIVGDTHRRYSPGLRDHASRWLDALRRAAATPPRPPEPTRSLAPAQEGLLTLARLLVTSRAREAEVAPGRILPAVEAGLADVLCDPPRDRGALFAALGLAGWRAALVGEDLWALLTGALAATAESTAEGVALAWRGRDGASGGDPL